MKDLKVVEINGIKGIDSREVAEVTDKQHGHLMRDIKGYVEILNQSNFGVVDFFVESTYQDGKGEIRPCYLLTRKGCDMVANKMTGEKGVLFTAAYVTKFEEIENVISNNQLIQATEKITRLEATLDRFEKLTEEARQQYKPSHKRKLDYNRLIKAMTANEDEADTVKTWVFATLGVTKWEDTCVADSKKILDIVTTVSRMLSVKTIEQLNLF